MDWIIIKKDRWKAEVGCPKCRRRFTFAPECLDKNSRMYWKCCPICGEIEDKYIEIDWR